MNILNIYFYNNNNNNNSNRKKLASMKSKIIKKMTATVYSSTKCVWCTRVITLLNDNDIETTKIDITKDNLEEMQNACGGEDVYTVPQVIIDDVLIGGFTETERFINKYRNESGYTAESSVVNNNDNNDRDWNVRPI